MAKKKQIPELKVLFDTNVLFTQTASDLVKPEVALLVKEHSNYPDHKISWHIPDIVRHERQFQMIRAGLKLVPSINKLEKLLGHNLGINEHILEERVRHAVDTQMSELRLNLAKVDVSKVDWDKMILNSVYRRPPFDPGESEKGFRDALVIESLLRLIEQSPVTPTVCRVVLVSEDKLLSVAAQAASTSFSNVRILNTLEELRGLISTLVSAVDEKFVEEMHSKAQPYFFVKEDKTTLFYKDELRSKIKEKFSSELAAKPDGVTEIESDTWYIGNPRFVKKNGQRVFWASRIEATFTGYKTEYKLPQSPGLLGLSSAPSPAAVAINSLASLITPKAEKVLVLKYGVIFEIDWSVTINAHKKFSSPKIEGIRYVETQSRKNE
jgi:hypothetical protein